MPRGLSFWVFWGENLVPRTEYSKRNYLEVGDPLSTVVNVTCEEIDAPLIYLRHLFPYICQAAFWDK